MTAYCVRRSQAGDVAFLPEIERRAGARFAEAGLPEVAAHEPTSAEDHLQAIALAQHWVATDAADRPVGFALVHVHGGCAHLEEISVHPDHGRRGLGRRLLDTVVDWAREAGLPAVTLSTFRDVAFNAPWYEHYGFRTLDEGELSPDLVEIRRDEAAAGLDPAARVCMRYDLG